jgi:alkylated DNA repair dioxygenase AlkB
VTQEAGKQEMRSIMFDDQFLSVSEADSLLLAVGALPWTRGTFMGNPVPREEVWMGPYPYRFSGRVLTPSPWIPEIMSLADRIEKKYGGNYNSVLLNRYASGRDGVAWHADDEPEMDPEHPIASVSLGAARNFKLRCNGQQDAKTVLLIHGSLLIMPAGFQQEYKHSIPKTKLPCKERINLTFRHMIVEGEKK